MRNTLLVVLLLLVAIGEALATGKAIFHNLAWSLAGLLLVSYLWAWYNVNWIELQRETPSSRSQVGKVVEERFLLHNRGPLPKLWVEVRDHSELPEHRASVAVSSLGPGRHRGWTVRTTCWRRGRYRLGPMTVLSGDPFGLFTRRQRLTATSSMVVYPLTVDLPRFDTLTGELSGGGAVHRRTHYVTPNVCGVRDYYPGDSFNRIHWLSTARTGRLIVKEFELDPAADIWLFLDMESAAHFERRVESGPPTQGPRLTGRPLMLEPSTEEYAVAVAASLSKHFIEHNRAVGLLAYGQHREMVQPERGQRQLTKILETLAVIRAQGHVGIGQLLSSEGAAFGRNAMAVVITPSAEVDWVAVLRGLRRRGVRGAGVIIDAASFGAPVDATPVLFGLVEAGIPAYRVREGESLVAALTNPAIPA